MGTQKLEPTKPTRLGNVEIIACQNGYTLFPYGRTYRDAGNYSEIGNHFVFGDFASLTAWLRKNLTHGDGVKP
jgi:hypothetical protein